MCLLAAAIVAVAVHTSANEGLSAPAATGDQNARDGNQPVPAAASPADRFDPAVVAAGSAAFAASCTQCHDAHRALSKKKDLNKWRATVQRMAGKNGAEVPRDSWEPIAVYLASLSAPERPPPAADAAAPATPEMPAANVPVDDIPESQFSLFGVFSPLYRGGNANIQNPGFIPEAWLGAAWQSPGMLSARATACISCHNELGQISRVEVVEAALRLDFGQLLSGCNRDVTANVDAGRFIVPFGAFSSQANPGLFRTVTKPLIFNMGQRVFNADIGDVVLPMPYSDEGAALNFGAPVYGNISTTASFYAVNGLQGGAAGIDFNASRDYVDNNTRPAAGGRVTVGNQFVRLGSSLMSGRFNPSSGSGPTNAGLDYQIFGFDVSARCDDLFRFQAEYAERDSDRVVGLPGQLLARERVGGYYIEGELRICEAPRISLLARYDGVDRRSPLPPPESSLATGRFRIDRFTWGLNTVLPGGSLLMLNHEYWWLPAQLPNGHVLGVRWAAIF